MVKPRSFGHGLRALR